LTSEPDEAGHAEAGRAEITAARWLGLPVRLRGSAPGLFRELAARFD
jgi:hypothetical protein